MSRSAIVLIYAPIVEAGAIVVTAIAACWALRTWRHEMVGRRRADLAAETLALFYEARDIISAAPHGGCIGCTGRTRRSHSPARLPVWAVREFSRASRQNKGDSAKRGRGRLAISSRCYAQVAYNYPSMKG
jgi:hypothetical protein